MCGFAGYIHNYGTFDKEEVIHKMADRIKHRGPDDAHYYIDDGIALGFRRLSIIDLEGGRQPILNEDGSLVLLFNGEIYNYQELREELIKAGHVFTTKTDSETILHGYEEYGKKILDRLRGMETLRIFGRGEAETENIRRASQDFRQRTMEVLRLAFLSSGVLEFFTSLSIALVAVYFGFSYLGALDFGHYGTAVTLSAGFLALILAPEFFQPLRDLGTFYHAKAQAVGAADSLKTFLETPLAHPERGDVTLNAKDSVTIEAQDFSILSPEGKVLAGPLNFTLPAGQRVVLVGISGSGKSSLLNALSGFMAYTGSLRINKTELRNLDPDAWRKQLSWVGQNPQLPASTLRENVLLARPDAREDELQSVLDRAWVSEFLPLLPQGVDTVVGDQSAGLSVGQAQRVAVARALLNPCQLMLLDEPAASLDAHSEQRVMEALNAASLQQTTLMVTHQLEGIADWDQIWVMENGRIVEQGDYASLVAAQGPFATLLANRQEDI